MSNSDKLLGVENFKRQTWDMDYYEKKAKERMAHGDDSDEETSRKFPRAPPGLKGPPGSDRAYLKARDSKFDLEKQVGKIQIVDANAAESKKGGFWCDVCKCLLKDSSSYLDHVNGKKHQRMLGFSMRVEKASLESVKEKFASLKRKKEEKELEKLDFNTLYEMKKKQKEEEEAKKREQRKAKRRRKHMKEEEEEEEKYDDDKDMNKEEKSNTVSEETQIQKESAVDYKEDNPIMTKDINSNNKEDTTSEGQENSIEAMKAMMGFTDFGGKK
ncbi:hypothetical protein WA158_002955 [Blastocystis sp. Blastoise]